MDARPTSAIPGRLRLKAAEVKNNPSLAHQVEERICSLDGVHRVHVNPVTGSLLIFYDVGRFALGDLASSLEVSEPDSWQDLVAGMLTGGTGAAKPEEQALSVVARQVDEKLRSATGVGLQSFVPYVLIVLGLWRLLAGDKAQAPEWHHLLWYAFGIYTLGKHPTSAHPA